MALSGVHLLLTYRCLYECDHCFLYCSPRMEGTLTLADVREAIAQGAEAGIEWLYLEGGEPFLYYALMLEAARLARARTLKVGIVTNGYWAVSEEDAALWLRPLAALGIDDFSVSEDLLHSSDPEHSPARLAYNAAGRLGLPVGRICVESPSVDPRETARHGEPVIGGNVSFRGRAVEMLIEGLPRRPFSVFTECTDEDLANPGRVHIDPFGNVLVCQGLSIGNIRERTLREIMEQYRPAEHPIIGPLLRGGPAELARTYGLPAGEEYVSACHLCYLVRRNLLSRFPAELCPPQVYGV
jgi:MoaA/NifB/PqqE/SkfB family radical SAM enzyme